MFVSILLAAILCLAMVLPYLPGRFDASAATFSFVVQAASYASLLMVPVGLAWMVNRRRSRLWHRLALVLGGLVAFVITIAAVSMNQLALGVVLAVGAILFLLTAYRRWRTDSEHIGHSDSDSVGGIFRARSSFDPATRSTWPAPRSMASRRYTRTTATCCRPRTISTSQA